MGKGGRDVAAFAHRRPAVHTSRDSVNAAIEFRRLGRLCPPYGAPLGGVQLAPNGGGTPSLRLQYW
jgi:hypothetical protein